MRFSLASSLALSFALSLGACGSSDVELDGDSGANPGGVDADPNAPDSDPSAADASVGCAPSANECNNCVDDDGDTLIDGADPECTGLLDDDESSFATGIPGDNKDAKKQDCFFDGDSGAGNDGCDVDICCLIPTLPECAGATPDCSADGQCAEKCGPLTPPGCDCFGCCTVCNGTDCVDVLVNPAIYEEESCANNPNPELGECCESENLEGCYTCVKSEDCSGETCNDDPEDCVLCPGQTEDDLPDSCELAECPAGIMSCNVTADCGADEFCSNGCCVEGIIVD